MKTYRRLRQLAVAAFALVVAHSLAPGQESGRVYRRTNVHNGNQVKSVFGNWGVIGQPCSGGPRGAWRYDNDGYLGDVSPLVGAEVTSQGKRFHVVETCPVDRPTTASDTDPRTGVYWTFEPVNGYFNPYEQKVAMSTDKTSWPSAWPDKMNDPIDPGWRGKWDGYFGKDVLNADQESFFVMDDNNNARFNDSLNNPLRVEFKPDSTDPTRNGLALVMRVRGLQWAQFLAKDNIFWLYEIQNEGTTTYTKVVFGLLVGTYVGVTGCDDRPQEYNNDWSFYDIQTNLTYTGNYPPTQMKNPLWQGNVGLVGYAFLESPGNPFDGVDNDGDADSSLVGRTAPQFQERDFTDSTLVAPGTRLVVIDTNFVRSIYTVPDTDSVLVDTRGFAMMLYPHANPPQYIKPEGGRMPDGTVNPNAYDGADNDFDGLIDENYFIHYHQIKKDNSGKTLIDILRPVRHIDYFTGAGSSPYSMIDERRDDLIDNNQNWNVLFDDVGIDGVPNTGDYGEGDGLPTSGYARPALNQPGEPHVDKTDVNESDQIGLTDFYYFTPANNIALADKEALWKDLAPGFFSVPSSIVNNRPQGGEDGDFMYGSGYFPLLAGQTERFSLALVYGGYTWDIDQNLANLLVHKKTVQKIYDANYQFPKPPDKPTLTAVPGDHKVTLYWDRKAEATVDAVLHYKTFEGYKIYRSTDPTFSDIFTITDASGEPVGYKPLVQFDLKDGVTGYFQAPSDLFEESNGYSYYLGSDNGIVHSYVDSSVENGRRYFYAVVAYSRGDDTLGIFPAENDKFITIASSGAIDHGINVAVVTPSAPVAGFVPPANALPLTAVKRYGTGRVYYSVVDQTKVTDHTYEVEFLDTQVDSIDNNGNGIMDAADSTEWARITTFYSVRDTSTIVENFVSQDTILIYLQHKNLIPSTVVIRNAQGSVVAPANYRLDYLRGTIVSTAPGSLPPGNYTLTFKYFPVYHSPYIAGSPYLSDTKDADIFDGVELAFNNAWAVLEDTSSRWVGLTAYHFSFAPVDVFLGPGDTVRGYRSPEDYDIIFSDSFVDTSEASDQLGTSAIPVKFRLFDRTDSTYLRFYYTNGRGAYQPGEILPDDELVFIEEGPDGKTHLTWDLYLSAASDTVFYHLHAGDTLKLRTTKPFRQGDVLQFTTVPAHVEQAAAESQLSRVRVVPNPYVAASAHELPLPPGITTGRGERRIEFTHIPAAASIKIFTARGQLVKTLHQDGNIEDGTVAWNLRSEENLDIAFGVYFYVVESSVGTKTGKIAIIK